VLRRGGSPQRLLTTVLFTDIVGSTERAARLGDRGWKDLVARHHAIVRRELRRFRGRELDTAGDGFFATFERPAQAIECAAAIIDDLRALDLQIRAGIHMGEAEVMGGKVGGVTVHVASRAMSQASADEILVTSTVREVTAGADVRFSDRGVHQFKGVPGEWRLYAVEWEHRAAADSLADAAAVSARQRRQGRLAWAVALGAIVVALVVTSGAVVFLVGRGAPTPAPLVAIPNSALGIDPATDEVRAVVAAGDSPTGLAVGDGVVWVLSLSDKLLTGIPVEGGSPRTIGLPGAPTGIAAGDGSVWITFGFGAAGEDTGVVLRFSAITQRQEQSIPIGSGASAIALGEGSVWVANGLDDTVTRIDPQTRAIVKRIEVAQQPGALVTGEGVVWVAHVVDQTIWRLDAASGTKVHEITLRDAPTAIALGFGRLWITSNAGNSLTVIDAATNALVTTLPLDQGPRGIATGASAVWIAGSRNALLRIDPVSLAVSGSVSLPGPAEGVAVSGETVWVTVQE
jgi:YVTN family beta-propeller protein